MCYESHTPEELWQLYLDGRSEEVFAAIYERHQGPLMRYLRKATGLTVHDLSDVTQSTWLRVAAAVQPVQSFWPWLVQTAMNQARGFCAARQKRRHLGHSLAQPHLAWDRWKQDNPEEDYNRQEALERYNLACAALTVEDAAILRTHLDGGSLATATTLHKGNAGRRLEKTLQLLRGALCS